MIAIPRRARNDLVAPWVPTTDRINIFSLR